MQENNGKSMKGQCASCLLPFRQDPEGANRESDIYCSLCFKDGKLRFEGNLREFKKMCYSEMTNTHHIPKWKACFFTFLIGFAPRWKNEWKLIRGIY